MDSQFGEVLGTEVGQFVMLPMCPEVFDWIQLGRIGRQELQVDGALLALDILAHQPTAMRLEPIPDDQQLSVAQMSPQRFEEGDDLRRPHIVRRWWRWWRTVRSLPCTRWFAGGSSTCASGSGK